MGYGRIEYLSAMIVSGIVLYAGITSAVESVKKIIHPEKPDYSTLSLVIIAVAVAAKVVLGKYVKAQGRKVHSGSLEASGADALNDAVLSASVLACAIIFKLTGISLEAWVGIVISVFIVKAGIEMLSETLDEILGSRSDKELTLKIKKLLSSEPEVQGAYDLIIYNFGPDRNYASVHLELPETMTAKEIDKLTRKMEKLVFKETGVILTGMGLYSYNTENNEAGKIEKQVREKVMTHDWALQLHGFYLDNEKKEMTFDVVMSFDIDHKEGLKIINEELKKEYPEYSINIVPDVDISD